MTYFFAPPRGQPMLSDIIKSESGLTGRHNHPVTVPTIVVDGSPSGDILVEHRGNPVWPVAAADEWHLVSRLCQERSIRIQKVKGQSGETKPKSGLVTGLGCSKI